MMKRIAFAVLAASLLTPAWQAALAQGGQEPGAMAGGSYLPSTHTKGCSGVLCDGNDPQRAPGAPPPPPCQGLMCSLSPYSMGRPVTAAEAQRLQEQQARPVAAPVGTAEPKRSKRSARRRKKAAGTVAARTPDPAPSAAR